MAQPLLYSDLASWWPLISRPEDYTEEAGIYAELLRSACKPRNVLELGSGGGNNASHLKRSFEMTLCDLSPGMLNVSRALNPECEHQRGDMRDVRLGREFDAVFMHDAIMYMATEQDLGRAIGTAAQHCRKGGAVLLAPDRFREDFDPKTSHGGHDGQGRSARYMQWEYDPDPADTWYFTDFVFLLREGNGPAKIVHDRHTDGIFPRNTWLELCRKAGLEPVTHMPDHSEVGHLDVIVARKARG